MRHLLLDTHIFLWSQFAPSNLSPKLAALFAAEDVCWHLSQISVLEIQIKYDLGKLELPDPPQKFLPNLIQDSGLNFHPLENKAIYMLGKLPHLHRDPFDRLLIASALVKGWEIATVDTTFDQYPVQIVN
jgi:PIN domain nuclease of toxin-antitoxin system